MCALSASGCITEGYTGDFIVQPSWPYPSVGRVKFCVRTLSTLCRDKLLPTSTPMVRYKARYLLFNILYPTAQQLTSSIPSSIQTSGELAVLLRETLSQQFGDWGSGIAGGLSGTFSLLVLTSKSAHCLFSEVLLTHNLNGNSASWTRTV